MLMGFWALWWLLAPSVRTAEAEPAAGIFLCPQSWFFFFLFFFPSPAELALEFEVQNDVLEVAEEALCLIPPSAGFRPIIYLPLRGLLVLDGDPDCIRFAENL